MSDYKPLACLPVLPLRGIVVFPGCVTHFDVGRSRSARAVEEAMRADQMIFLVAQRDVQCDEPKKTDLYSVGTVAYVRQILRLPGDNMRILVEGKYRAQLTDMIHAEPYLFARVGEAPGKTTHINFFRIDEAMYLVDLPGYGYAKVPQKEKERWGRLMEAYFAAPATLTFGVMLVDARHAPTANDVVMANYFLQSGKPFVVVANKLDKLKKSEIESNLARIREVLSLPDDVRLIPFSAEKGDGRDELLTVILHAAEQ